MTPGVQSKSWHEIKTQKMQHTWYVPLKCNSFLPKKNPEYFCGGSLWVAPLVLFNAFCTKRVESPGIHYFLHDVIYLYIISFLVKVSMFLSSL